MVYRISGGYFGVAGALGLARNESALDRAALAAVCGAGLA